MEESAYRLCASYEIQGGGKVGDMRFRERGEGGGTGECSVLLKRLLETTIRVVVVSEQNNPTQLTDYNNLIFTLLTSSVHPQRTREK
jgi:hypothetical protein